MSQSQKCQKEKPLENKNVTKCFISILVTRSDRTDGFKVSYNELHY